MESLPPEVLLSGICRRLTLRENCRLCSASRYLYYEILPTIVADYRIEELVVQSSSFVSPAFVSRHLSTTVVRIVLILEKINKEMIDNLEGIVGACRALKSFEVKSTHKFYRNGLGCANKGGVYQSQTTRLSALISNLEINHISVDPRLKKLALPRSATSCCINTTYIGLLPYPNSKILNPFPDQVFQNIVVLDVLLLSIDPSLWKNFDFFPSVRDFTLRGERPNEHRLNPFGTLPLPPNFQNFLHRLERLALYLPFHTDELRCLIPLESTTLKVLRLSRVKLVPLPDAPHSDARFFCDISRLPSLRDFEIGVNCVADECALFQLLTGDGECDWNANPSLERIFLRFDPTDWLSTRYKTADFTTSRYLNFPMKALRNLFFRIETIDEWDAVYDVLLTVQSLEELTLLFCLATDDCRGQFPYSNDLVSQIRKRAFHDGRIQTQISRLKIADLVSFNEAVRPYYPFHECCFDVLDCFQNVGMYDLNTSHPVIAPTVTAKKAFNRWRNNCGASSRLTLNVKWYTTPPYGALQLLNASLTHLKITTPGSCCKINLGRIVDCTKNLTELVIEGYGKIEALPSLLDFPKLERFVIRHKRPNVDRIEELKSVLSSRPVNLREVCVWWPQWPDLEPTGKVRSIHQKSYFGSGRATWFVTPFGVREYCQSV